MKNLMCYYSVNAKAPKAIKSSTPAKRFVVTVTEESPSRLCHNRSKGQKHGHVFTAAVLGCVGGTFRRALLQSATK